MIKIKLLGIIISCVSLVLTVKGSSYPEQKTISQLHYEALKAVEFLKDPSIEAFKLPCDMSVRYHEKKPQSYFEKTNCAFLSENKFIISSNSTELPCYLLGIVFLVRDSLGDSQKGEFQGWKLKLQDQVFYGKRIKKI